MSTCTVKHTKYQPTDEEWKCPKCSRGVESFWINESPANGECEMLHDEDDIRCFECGYETTWESFAAMIQEQKNLVTCPCCKGKGLVPRDNAGASS